MEDFRKDIADLSPGQASDRLIVYAFELNLLIRFAVAHGVHVEVSLGERDGIPRIFIRSLHGESGGEGLR